MTGREQAFLEHLVTAQPGDPTALVYADWLEDESRPEEAAAHRWAWERRERPTLAGGRPCWWFWPGETLAWKAIQATCLSFLNFPGHPGLAGYRNAFGRLGMALAHTAHPAQPPPEPNPLLAAKLADHGAPVAPDPRVFARPLLP